MSQLIDDISFSLNRPYYKTFEFITNDVVLPKGLLRNQHYPLYIHYNDVSNNPSFSRLYLSELSVPELDAVTQGTDLFLPIEDPLFDRWVEENEENYDEDEPVFLSVFDFLRDCFVFNIFAFKKFNLYGTTVLVSAGLIMTEDMKVICCISKPRGFYNYSIFVDTFQMNALGYNTRNLLMMLMGYIMSNALNRRINEISYKTIPSNILFVDGNLKFKSVVKMKEFEYKIKQQIAEL